MVELQVRDLRPGDRDAALDVRHRSFGPLPPAALAWWDPLYATTVADRRALGVFAADTLVAVARMHEYRQLWGGRALPMAGVAGVVVAPEWRGRGVATLLMRAVLDRCVELGDVVSVLYPAALPPYRRVGYEVAGTFTRTAFAATALRALGGPRVAVRRAGRADVDEVVATIRQAEASCYDCGPLALTRAAVEELVSDPDNFCYLADDGFLVYAWDGQDLRVERLLAAGSVTTRGLWALVGSGSSAVREIFSFQPGHDPLHWIVDEPAVGSARVERWMLRILDVTEAIARRGFPAGVDASVPLVLEDSELAGNAGAFRLDICGGSGSLVRLETVAPDAVRLAPRGLAAMYAGTPLATVHRAGLVAGGTAAQRSLLDAAFAGRAYLVDRF